MSDISVLRMMVWTGVLALHVACARPIYESHDQPGFSGAGGDRADSEKASACPTRFRQSHACLTWVWSKVPSSGEPGSLIFKIYRGNAYDDTPVLVDPGRLPAVVLLMPSMGHGSSPTTVTALDIGTYRADNVFFIMPGDWQVRFQIKDGTHVEDEAVVDLTI